MLLPVKMLHLFSSSSITVNRFNNTLELVSICTTNVVEVVVYRGNHPQLLQRQHIDLVFQATTSVFVLTALIRVISSHSTLLLSV